VILPFEGLDQIYIGNGQGLPVLFTGSFTIISPHKRKFDLVLANLVLHNCRILSICFNLFTSTHALVLFICEVIIWKIIKSDLKTLVREIIHKIIHKIFHDHTININLISTLKNVCSWVILQHTKDINASHLCWSISNTRCSRQGVTQ
jgi:hypothetical protein